MRRKSSEISEALAAQGYISRRKQAHIRRYLARKPAKDEASVIDKTQALAAMLDETRAADPQLGAAGPIGFSGLDGGLKRPALKRGLAITPSVRPVSPPI